MTNHRIDRKIERYLKLADSYFAKIEVVLREKDMGLKPLDFTSAETQRIQFWLAAANTAAQLAQVHIANEENKRTRRSRLQFSDEDAERFDAALRAGKLVEHLHEGEDMGRANDT